MQPDIEPDCWLEQILYTRVTRQTSARVQGLAHCRHKSCRAVLQSNTEHEPTEAYKASLMLLSRL